MKKKILTIALALTMVLSFTACGGNKKPADMSQKAYDLGMEALDVIDGYIEGDMTEEACEDKLDDMLNEIESIVENEDSGSKDDGVRISIWGAIIDVGSPLGDEIYKLKKTRDELAEELNQPQIY